jgi:hypothetical protein
MTKVTIIGDETPIEKKNPIEFVRLIGITHNHPACSAPFWWDNIELVCKDYGAGYDLMFAYNNNKRLDGLAYIGHFNDGIVEEEVCND